MAILIKKIDSHSKNLEKVKSVLKANNIDENILDTAMPIYVAEPFSDAGESTIAFYVDDRFDDTLQKFATTLFGSLGTNEGAELIVSTPTLPFVVIRPSYASSSDLYVVAAHEIGHHYASLACAERGTTCSRNNFIDETLPNFFSANVTPNNEQPEGNTINRHHGVYINHGTCYSIGTVLPEPTGDICHEKGSFQGYPQYAFLQNYADVVPNAIDKMLDALVADDALQYLYDHATPEEFAEVMVNLSQKNLANDYNQKSLVSADTPTGEELPCEFCTETYKVNPAAMRYFYLPKEAYSDYRVQIVTRNNLVISVMGQKSDGKYEVISEQKNNFSFDYLNTSEYQQIVFAAVNTSIDTEETLIMSLQPISEEIVKLQELEDYYNGLDIKVSSDCIEGSVLEIVGAVQKIFDLFGDITGDTDSASEFRKQADTVSKEMGGRKMRICQRIMNNTSVDSAKRLVQKVLPGSFAIRETNDSGIYLNLNLLTGKIDAVTIGSLDEDAIIVWLTVF